MTDIRELKKVLGIGSCVRSKKDIIHPKNDSDMCDVLGITYAMSYKKVKERGYSDEMIVGCTDHDTWFREKKEYQEQQEKIKEEKNKMELPF